MLPLLAIAASIVGIASANPLEFGYASTPQLYPRAACDGNTASTRSEWCDYSTDTDYYNTVPETGVTREFWVSICLPPTAGILDLTLT